MNTTPNILVGIMSSTQIEFNLDGKFQLNGSTISSKAVHSVTMEKGKMKLSGSEELVDELYFTPIDIEIAEFELSDVTIGVNFHWEQKENQRFQGALKLIIEKI